MWMLDVGPTIDAASWRSIDGGVYARGPEVYASWRVVSRIHGILHCKAG